MPLKSTHPAVALGTALVLCCAACGGLIAPDGTLPTPSEACVGEPVTQLAVGEHVILDPAATRGCLRLPQAGAAGAQYLLVLASTNGTRSSTGISGSYLLRSTNPLTVATASAARIQPAEAVAGGGEVAAQFDATLRRLEHDLAADPRNRLPLTAPRPAPAPPLGDVKSFKTCSNLACTAFTTVQATARYVGTHAVVYLDNDVPQQDPLTDADLANLGQSFDNFHYPIDTTAFGRESDLDGNGVVIILATDAVNNLTADCTNGRVIGYFFGGDLLTGPNSNRAEIFYTLVPEPARATHCNAVTHTAAVNNLKPTLIHEFQHMISFNQHVLLRSGNSEEVWLNEAMSHFAEELGGRLIPDSECPSPFTSCRSQYASGDIQDSYDYLRNTESQFVVFPTSSSGTLEERGAVWLFLRWTLDHFSTDSIQATATTRALDATALTGVANITGATGGDFSEMVPRWLMAAYLDDGPDLPFEPTGWLRFKSWGLRGIWTNPANAQVFPAGFPLVPISLSSSSSIDGTLRAGSGRHFLLLQPANGAAWDVQVLKSTAGEQLDASLTARFGLVRIH